MTDHYDYFVEAQLVACNASCLKAKCGSVVVDIDGNIIGLGFNAPPLEDESQRKCSASFDTDIKPKYDKTCCVHAEWAAILDALRTAPDKVKGSTLYFMRIGEKDEFTDAGVPFCTVCSRLALQAGIAQFGLWNDGPEMWDTAEYNLVSYQHSEI